MSIQILLAFVLTLTASGASANAMACRDIFSAEGKPRANQAERANQLSRDLEVTELINRLKQQFALSDLAGDTLRDGLLSSESSLYRGKLIRQLVENPTLLSSVEGVVNTIRGSTEMKGMLASKLDRAQPTLREIKAVYVTLSPVVSAIAPFVVGIPGAVALVATHASMEGTAEHSQLEKMKGLGIMALKFAKAKAAQVVNPRVDALREMSQKALGTDVVELGRCTLAACINFASATASEIVPEILDGASTNLRLFLAELEVGLVMAQVARDWRVKGLPITQVELSGGKAGDSSVPSLNLEGAIHPIMAMSDQRLEPLSISLNAQQGEGGASAPQAKVVMITGDNGAGKSTLLTTIGWYSALARVGGYVPAKHATMSSHLLQTLLKPVDSQANGTSLLQSEIAHLKEIAGARSEGPSLILLDEPLRGTSDEKRVAIMKQFVDTISDGSSLVIFSTHSRALIHDLAPQSFALTVDRGQDGGRQVRSGVHSTTPADVTVDPNMFE
jgi:hypothetical protein